MKSLGKIGGGKKQKQSMEVDFQGFKSKREASKRPTNPSKLNDSRQLDSVSVQAQMLASPKSI